MGREAVQRLRGRALVPEGQGAVVAGRGEEEALHGVEDQGTDALRVGLEEEDAVRLARVVEDHVAIVSAHAQDVAVVRMPRHCLRFSSAVSPTVTLPFCSAYTRVGCRVTAAAEYTSQMQTAWSVPPEARHSFRAMDQSRPGQGPVWALRWYWGCGSELMGEVG